jgi:hypothetical protein
MNFATHLALPYLFLDFLPQSFQNLSEMCSHQYTSVEHPITFSYRNRYTPTYVYFESSALNYREQLFAALKSVCLNAPSLLRGGFAFYQSFFSALRLWEKVVPPSHSKFARQPPQNNASDSQQPQQTQTRPQQPQPKQQQQQQQKQKQQREQTVHVVTLNDIFNQCVSQRTVNKVFEFLPYLKRFFTFYFHLYNVRRQQSGGVTGSLAYYCTTFILYCTLPWP